MFSSKLRSIQSSKLKGQATVEYLIVFVLLALLTLVSLSTFYPRVQQAGERLFKEATEGIGLE